MLPAINHLYIIAVLMLCQLLVEADYEQCGSQYSIFGMMLRGHTFKRFNVSISFECNQACMSDFRCHSFHFVITNVCSLPMISKALKIKDFRMDTNVAIINDKKNCISIALQSKQTLTMFHFQTRLLIKSENLIFSWEGILGIS